MAPTGEERGGAYRLAMRTACLVSILCTECNRPVYRDSSFECAYTFCFITSANRDVVQRVPVGSVFFIPRSLRCQCDSVLSTP